MKNNSVYRNPLFWLGTVLTLVSIFMLLTSVLIIKPKQSTIPTEWQPPTNPPGYNLFVSNNVVPFGSTNTIVNADVNNNTETDDIVYISTNNPKIFIKGGGFFIQFEF